MTLKLYFIPKFPNPNSEDDPDAEPIVFADHVGAVIPLVGDLYWFAGHPRKPVRIVERGFSYRDEVINVSLIWEWA
jgi:hypothetical protein